jgi:hypothetical protein
MKLWPESIWTVSHDQSIPMFIGGVGSHVWLRPCDTVRLDAQPLFDEYVFGTLIRPLERRRRMMISRTAFNNSMRVIRDHECRWFLKCRELFLTDSDSLGKPLWSPDTFDTKVFMSRERALAKLVELGAIEIELWKSSGSFDEVGHAEDINIFRKNARLLSAAYKFDGIGFATKVNGSGDNLREPTGVISLADAQNKAIYAVAVDRLTPLSSCRSGPYVFWDKTDYTKWTLGADLECYTISFADAQTPDLTYSPL